MMQSILSPRPANAPTSERASNLCAADKQSKSDELPLPEELAGHFSDLLGSVIANEKAEENGTELPAEEEEVDEVAVELVADALCPEPDNETSAVQLALLPTEQHSQERDKSVAENELLLENSEEAPQPILAQIEAAQKMGTRLATSLKTAPSQERDESVAENELLLENSEEALQPPYAKGEAEASAPQPILAQIEAAQKMDTRLATSLKTAASSDETPELSAQLKKGQEKVSVPVQGASLQTDAGEKELLNGDLKNVPAAEPLTAEEDKSLKVELPLQATAKPNQFLFANNSAAETSGLTNTVESGLASANHLHSSHLDKVLNQNIQTASTAPALQQPLEMQAKHASALLSERVLMMINQGKQEVLIRLDPAELGSMHIKLHVQQDQLQLSIQTEVAQSREIIEQNLPKLREQLAQQGVSLGEASVEQHGQRQQAKQQGKNALQETFPGDAALPVTDEKMQWRASKLAFTAQGIDYYA